MADLTTPSKLQVIFQKQEQYAYLTAVDVSLDETTSSVIARLKVLYFNGSLYNRLLFATYRIMTSQELVISIMNLSSVRTLGRKEREEEEGGGDDDAHFWFPSLSFLSRREPYGYSCLLIFLRFRLL